LPNDFIEETFSELDAFYPGSKRKRRKPVPEKPVVEVVPWEDEYFEKFINGQKVKLYTLGSLAKAINRSPKTLRKWMEQGKFPQSPYRMPDTVGKNGKTYVGRRLYSKAMVDAVVKIFASAGLLHADRVELSTHRNLADKITEVWNEIRTTETN
jgi:hypothetical protein